jgi:aspartate racemase
MRTIGLLGGMSCESTAVYYRLLNEGVRARLGGLHSARLLLWSADFAEIEVLQIAGDWGPAGTLLGRQARTLETAGAEAILICSNTMHRVADAVQRAVGVPLLHLAEATAMAAQKIRVRRPLLLGTRFTMEQDFYLGCLRQRRGLDAVVPRTPQDRAEVDRIIYQELCQGRITLASRERYLAIIRRAVQEQEVDAVIYGCTEVGLLISPEDHPGLPGIDTTRVHVDAAIEFALAQPAPHVKRRIA